MRPQRGEIWRVDTPWIPEDPHTPRFGLIVSINRRNYKKDDFLVVPIFSEGEEGPTRVVLPEGEGGMHHESILFCDEVTCISEYFVVMDEGSLGPAVDDGTLDKVVIGIRRAVGDIVPL